MRGKRKVPLHIKVSSSSTAPKQKKSPKKSSSAKVRDTYPSTLVTSPLSPSNTRISKRIMLHEDNEQNDSSYSREGLTISNDYDDKYSYQPMTSKRRTNATPQFGPPITTDERMSSIPDVHRYIVENFVKEAKDLADNIRKSKNLRYPLFTEANFREMAIQWTTELSNMRKISGINTDLVDRYGDQFLPLLLKCSESYEQMMKENNRVAVEVNHPIHDISSDDDDIVIEKDNLKESEKRSIAQAEQSRYFAGQSSASKGQSRTFSRNRKSQDGSTVSKGSWSKAGRGSFSKKGGSRRSSGRSSNGSIGSGVSKNSRYQSGSKTSGTGTASKQSGLMSAFGRKGGRGSRGGGSGSGIGMMPT